MCVILLFEIPNINSTTVFQDFEYDVQLLIG